MAFMNKERKAELAPGIKAVLKKYGMKGTISVNHYNTLVVTLKSGPITFDPTVSSVNIYWIDDHYAGVARKFLTDLLAAMKGISWYDRSDAMTDYDDIAWYNDINIGRWGKAVWTDYVVTA